MEDILVPIAFFAMIAVLVIAPKYLRSRDRQRLLDTLRVAYDRGQPVPPELFEALTAADVKAEASPDRDLRTGIILIAVAFAFIVFGFGIADATGEDRTVVIAAAGAFPGFVGIGHLVFWIAQRGRARRTGA